MQRNQITRRSFLKGLATVGVGAAGAQIWLPARPQRRLLPRPPPPPVQLKPPQPPQPRMSASACRLRPVPRPSCPASSAHATRPTAAWKW